MTLAAVEQAYILDTLDALDWNKSAAARALGITLSTLYRKLARYRARERQQMETMRG
jgi:DNA-binding NtrC family response regulator